MSRPDRLLGRARKRDIMSRSWETFDRNTATPERRQFFDELVSWMAGNSHQSMDDILTRASVMFGGQSHSALVQAREEARHHKQRMENARVTDAFVHRRH